MMERDEAELFASWFRCLADPTRIQILSLLASKRRPMAVGEIVGVVGMSQSTVSEHLRRLAETCFVHVEHRGSASLFRVNEACIDCLPSAAELVMGDGRPVPMPAPRPGATSRRARWEARRRGGDVDGEKVPTGTEERKGAHGHGGERTSHEHIPGRR